LLQLLKVKGAKLMPDSMLCCATNQQLQVAMSDTFFFADWQVDPAANSLRRGKQLIQLEPKAMDVLLLLCRHAGEVLSSDDIVRECWPDTDTGDNPLHKTITQLRKALGDNATNPVYIETIRKRGYRTLAEVRFPLGQQQSVQAQSWQQGSPFPGLQAYDARYASVFFGRGIQINTLLSRIAQQIKYGRDCCLLLGPSGSGKSSLINAGVMPNLMQQGGYNGVEVLSFSSLDLADVAAGQLLTDLAGSMLDWELNEQPVFAGDSAQSLAALLATDPQQVMQRCLQQLPKNAQTKQRFALFVDRLEVLLSSPLFSAQQRTDFVALLEQLATSGAVLVLSACRNEFYPLLVDYPSLIAGKAKGAHFDLAAPGRADLLQMIRLPALAAGLSFDTDPATAMGLDEMLCTEAASNPDALPMLQYTLQQLYLQRSADNKLLLPVYKALGGIEGAIGKNAEQAITGLSKAEQDSLPRVLSMLVTLREDEKSITSRSGRLTQLQTDAERTLVQTMVEQRLFVSHLQNGEPCFSIAHEALLRRWPRATAWISEHHDSLSVKSRLQHLTQRWLAEQQNSAYLLADGKPLQEAQTLLNNSLFSLEADERRFIQVSANKARLKRWTRRGTIAMLCLLSFTAVTMSFRSFNAEQLAQQKRLAAENLLGFMVGEFADKLRSIGRMDLLDGISNKALEYFSELSDEEEHQLNFEARFQHGQTLAAMGEVAYSRDKLDEALTAFQSSQSHLLPLLQQQPDNLALLKTLGANAFWLGQLKYDQSDWAGSLPLFEQYLSYSQQMYDVAPDDKEALMELSYAHNTLGSVSMKRLDFFAAQEDFEKSLQLKLLAQAKEPGNSQLLADVANARSWLASAALAQGDINTAIAVHEQLQKELSTAGLAQDPYLLERLAGSYQIMADLLSYQDRAAEAFSLAKAGLDNIQAALKQDPDNDIWKRQTYIFYIDLLKLSHAADQKPPISVDELHQLLATDATLAASSYIKPILAQYHLGAAFYYKALGNTDSSNKAAETAIELYHTLTDEFPQNMQYPAYFADSFLLYAANQKDSASSYMSFCYEAKVRLTPLIRQNKDPKYSVPFARALDCLGELDSESELLEVLTNSAITGIRF